uniref:PC-esterase domain-containing protein 1B n=1 Tax=Nyctereutes procyonoides TaxID=34880 RepID=UPI002444C9E5|nr:PC-esterase domain-containing protein 1B [Nyctereutes procyonoides]
MVHLQASEVQQLLHNKFVVILGDSVQRAVYKDLVLLLQKDCLLTTNQLKAKGEETFEKDELVDGGQMGPMHNGVQYREVRQFCAAHHLVRFYFLTRVYSSYLETVLQELQGSEHGPPDVVIMNSCLWDLSRYGPDSWRSYRENLASLFRRLGQVLPESCLLVWNTAMPVGKQITAGFLPPDHRPGDDSLIVRVIEANFYSSAEAKRHGFDVLDLHFHFRHAGQHRQRDGVHWDERAHRHLSQLLLAHVADAWGVELPRRDCPRPPYLCGPQDAYFSSGPSFQSDEFSSNYFHSDVLLPAQMGFSFEDDFMMDPQPPWAPFPLPYLQRAPVVHRGVPRYAPRGPYGPWGRQPRPSRRRAHSRPQPRPQ